jgi:biotin transporter BioY
MGMAYQVLPTTGFLILILFVSMIFGLMIASIAKSSSAAFGIANMIFMPVTFLSGGFFPIELIRSSQTLSAIA